MTQALLLCLAGYLLFGSAFVPPFLAFGVRRIDPRAGYGTWGFRLLIIPGTIFLWPLLARRWLSGSQVPEENNAHRRASRS
jgi:hypothetical protein